MRIPTFTLEGRKLPRVIFSIKSLPSSDPQEILSLARKTYDLGNGCFDLPSSRHLKSFRELKNLTEDQTLIGLGHVGAAEGVSIFGNPLHHLESKVISTVKKNLFPPYFIQNLKRTGVWNKDDFFPDPSSPEVLTQKDIDRISFDGTRFDQVLSSFRVMETPFLVLGGKYSDWLLGLGRTDLIEKMTSRIRAAGFIPVFSGRWPTFVLPKVKSLDLAAYAIPINIKRGLFDLPQACKLIKKFDKPLIGLDPFADGKDPKQLEEAFSFLFRELKIHAVNVELASEEEGKNILDAVMGFPSLIPPRKT